jgi:hypothetical protein
MATIEPQSARKEQYMIKAKTATELADHIEQYLREHQLNPGRALADATEDQMRMIVQALRRPPILRTTSQG